MTITAERQLLGVDLQGDSSRLSTAGNVARYVLWASLANIFLGVILWIALRNIYPHLVFYALLPVITSLAAWAYPALCRSGKTQLALYSLIGSVLFAAAAAPLIVSDLLLPVSIGFVLILMLGYMTLPDQATGTLVVIVVAALLFDILAVKLWFVHLVPQLDTRAGLAIMLMTGAFGLVGAGLISRQIIRDMFANNERAQQATLALENQMANEQRRLHLLQETVDRYVVSLNKVAEGDLKQRVEIRDLDEANASSDPLVLLGRHINLMTSRLQTTVVEIHEVATNLKASANEILIATQQQLSGASEQSAAITQTTSTVEEVRMISDHASSRAKEVAMAAQQTEETSRSGMKSVQDTIEIIEGIKHRMEAIAEITLSLASHTQQIRQITSTVSDLASQSDMLALNTAIEAAHAGEHGKGFAVVAAEVRNLANQSQAATRQIRDILQSIQNATNQSVMATEEGNKVVDIGVELAAQSQYSIQQLSEAIEMAKRMANQMVAGVQEQTSGMQQISVSIGSINTATLQNLASTRQTEQAAQNLNHLSLQLSEIVSKYHL